MAADVASVLIVGASVSGLHVAEQLRSQGYTGAVTLVGAEPHLPYDRPPLSKQVLLGTQSREHVFLRSRQQLDELGVALRLGCAAVGWDGARLTLADGAVLTADRLVVATGVVPRTLPGQPDHPAIGTLRTLDDAEWLAPRLVEGSTVAVVGGGLIGAEVASAARQRGCRVVLVEATELPMQRVLGEQAAGLLAEIVADAGVEFRGGVAVTGLIPDGDAVQVALAQGDPVRADTVVVGIGSVPQSAWLGIEGPGGVTCDERGRASALTNAYAVGDVAAWPDRHTAGPVRTEHWTSARTQAAVVAADIAGGAVAPEEPDYFWTDQFGLKIQVVGRPDLADRTVLVRPEDGGVRRSVVLYLRDGNLVGCGLFSAARLLGRLTGLIRDKADEATALAALAG